MKPAPSLFVRARRAVVAIAVLVLVVVCFLVVTQLRKGGQLKLPAGQRAPVVSIGDSHGLVLAADGSLWCWGGQDRGWPVLGLGSTNFTENLTRIGSETNWVTVSAGDDHNLALKSDGTIWAWGANYQGQFGDGNHRMRLANGKANVRDTPVQTLEDSDWAQVEAGFVTSYALKRNGTLWAWGLNNFSQLGNNSWTDSAKPIQVGTATNWLKIRAGGVSAGAIQSDGSLWIWGGSPKLGNTKAQSAENFLVPIRLTSDTNWVDVSVAFNIWLGIKSDGTLWAWGRSAYMFTGASQDACETPTKIGQETNWLSVWSSASGFYHLLKKRDGSFWVMDSPGDSHTSFKLTKLDLPRDIVASDANGGAIALITSDGEVWTCGRVLGQHSQTDRLVRFLETICSRLGWKAQLFHEPGSRIVREKPWRIRNVDPTTQSEGSR
jgi:alpha-tubulin suppressor-like RCC1 family protein